MCVCTLLVLSPAASVAAALKIKRLILQRRKASPVRTVDLQFASRPEKKKKRDACLRALPYISRMTVQARTFIYVPAPLVFEYLDLWAPRFCFSIVSADEYEKSVAPVMYACLCARVSASAAASKAAAAHRPLRAECVYFATAGLLLHELCDLVFASCEWRVGKHLHLSASFRAIIQTKNTYTLW